MYVSVSLSLVGYVAGSFIDPKYIGLLGLIPLMIGLFSYLQVCSPGSDDDDDDDEQEEEDLEQEVRSRRGLWVGVVYIGQMMMIDADAAAHDDASLYQSHHYATCYPGLGRSFALMS